MSDHITAFRGLISSTIFYAYSGNGKVRHSCFFLTEICYSRKDK